jgi:hypothetical protein
MEDHLTHLCPRLAEAQKLLAQQQPAVLTNPFPHGQYLTQASSRVDGGSQGPPPSFSNSLAVNAYMLKSDAHITNRAHNYGMPNTTEKGKGAENPSVPL